jgi:hypothetical protein
LYHGFYSSCIVFLPKDFWTIARPSPEFSAILHPSIQELQNFQKTLASCEWSGDCSCMFAMQQTSTSPKCQISSKSVKQNFEQFSSAFNLSAVFSAFSAPLRSFRLVRKTVPRTFRQIICNIEQAPWAMAARR